MKLMNKREECMRMTQIERWVDIDEYICINC